MPIVELQVQLEVGALVVYHLFEEGRFKRCHLPSVRAVSITSEESNSNFYFFYLRRLFVWVTLPITLFNVNIAMFECAELKGLHTNKWALHQGENSDNPNLYCCNEAKVHVCSPHNKNTQANGWVNLVSLQRQAWWWYDKPRIRSHPNRNLRFITTGSDR